MSSGIGIRFHHNGNPKLLSDLLASDTFNFQQFAYFLDRLRETQDADGPLLDTTMALYGVAWPTVTATAMSLPLVLAEEQSWD